MREIKFRVFNFNSDLDGDGKPSMKYSYCGDLNTNGVMQFTGLKDKNGKEIYEGDIVSCPIGTFEGVMKTAVVKYDSGFYIPLNLNSPETEVIGNIYENPELCNKNRI